MTLLGTSLRGGGAIAPPEIPDLYMLASRTGVGKLFAPRATRLEEQLFAGLIRNLSFRRRRRVRGVKNIG